MIITGYDHGKVEENETTETNEIYWEIKDY